MDGRLGLFQKGPGHALPSAPSGPLHPDNNSSSEPVSPEVSDVIGVMKSPSRTGPLGPSEINNRGGRGRQEPPRFPRQRQEARTVPRCGEEYRAASRPHPQTR